MISALILKAKEWVLIKVLTLNTHSWLETAPMEKLHQLADQIRRADYDLIALQEVNQLIKSPAVTPDHYFQPTDQQVAIHEDNFAYQLVDLLKTTGHLYHWSWVTSHIGYDRYEEGVAILAKSPLASEALLVSALDDPTDYHTRKLLLSQLEYEKQPLLAVSCHFSWWQDEQSGFAYEWQRLEEKLTSYQMPFILLGDFNNPAQSKGYQKIMNSPLRLQDSFLVADYTKGEHTVLKAIDGWQANQEKLRIDYQFVSAQVKVKTYRVLFDGQQTPLVSDHFGIEADLEI